MDTGVALSVFQSCSHEKGRTFLFIYFILFFAFAHLIPFELLGGREEPASTTIRSTLHVGGGCDSGG